MSMSRLTRSAAVACLAFICLTLAGCEDKVTMENYDQIQVGMTKLDVERLLGKGKDETPAAGGGISSSGLPTEGDKPDEIWVWTSEHGAKIVLTFAEGKVVAKRQQGLD